MSDRTLSALRLRRFTIWLVCSVIAALSCGLYSSAARIGDQYVPVGNDSFYHARRILDTVRDPAGFYEFDSKIHAPEGSLLVWPWGYDYAMAQLVRLGMAVGLSDDPMAILVWIPVAAVFLSMALLLRVTRQLSLSNGPTILAALCMALAPTTQFLHGTGMIDHHYAEMIFVLAALGGGLAWFRQPDNLVSAAALGAILGTAPAIHNGLFVLQLPLLITLSIRWLQGVRMPARSTLIFAVVLLATTLLVSIPSTAFREGRFEFYTLSWFHAYAALCTGLIVVLFSRLGPSRMTIGALAGLCVIFVVPVIGQIEIARSFVSGSAKWLETIAEMKSPLKEALTTNNAAVMAHIYSHLIWIAPATFLLCIAQCWRERATERLLFWVSAVVGLALLAAQVRMHYFGDFALYLPWLLLADGYAKAHPLAARKTLLFTSLALLLLYTAAFRQLFAPVPRANDHTFEDTLPIFSLLHDACAQDPGIVLADNNAGHYLRYYTDCSVIVNNFLLTPQHFAKMDEMERLFSLSPAELVAAAPAVKYVLVRPLDIRPATPPQAGYRYWMFLPNHPQLLDELLLGDPRRLPREYSLLKEIKFSGQHGDSIIYARLYKIERRRLPVAPSSANDGSY